jgi:hypothetical protein
MEDQEEVVLLKRRLKKVMKLAEKLKKENYLEYEVNKELARRNDALQKDMYETEERMKKAKLTIDRLENQFEQINDFTGILFSVYKTQQLLHFLIFLMKTKLIIVVCLGNLIRAHVGDAEVRRVHLHCCGIIYVSCIVCFFFIRCSVCMCALLV